jgi:hypothetical protein
MRLKLLFSGAMLVSATASQAVVITFDALGSAGTGVNYTGSGYAELGYVFSSSLGGGVAFGTFQSGHAAYTGSPSFFNDWSSGLTALTKADGTAFNAVSIDLCNLSRAGGTNQSVNFTGYRADNSSVSESFQLSNSANMTTFTFTAMTNIVRMDWVQVQPYHQFDNLTLGPVPEPVSVITLGVGVAAFLRRRRG